MAEAALVAMATHFLDADQNAVQKNAVEKNAVEKNAVGKNAVDQKSTTKNAVDPQGYVHPWNCQGNGAEGMVWVSDYPPPQGTLGQNRRKRERAVSEPEPDLPDFFKDSQAP